MQQLVRLSLSSCFSVEVTLFKLTVVSPYTWISQLMLQRLSWFKGWLFRDSREWVSDDTCDSCLHMLPQQLVSRGSA